MLWGRCCVKDIVRKVLLRCCGKGDSRRIKWGGFSEEDVVTYNVRRVVWGKWSIKNSNNVIAKYLHFYCVLCMISKVHRTLKTRFDRFLFQIHSLIFVWWNLKHETWLSNLYETFENPILTKSELSWKSILWWPQFLWREEELLKPAKKRGKKSLNYRVACTRLIANS